MKKIASIIIVALLLIGGASFAYSRFINLDDADATNDSPHQDDPVLGDDAVNVPTVRSRLLSASRTDVYTKTRIDSLTRAFNGGTFLPAQYEVDKYNVRLESTDENGRRINIFAQLFVPKSDDPVELPVYVFGQGTTGIGNLCAPSREVVDAENWGNYVGHMLSYASQGYIVMFPDYSGFNDTSRIHHYFIAELEANVLLDATRATYEFFEKEDLNVSPQDAVFYAGYSQGGHAAYAVGDYADSYAPDMKPKIKGLISYAGTMDITNLVKENPALTPYLVYAYSDLYGKDVVNPEDILLPNLLPEFENTVLNTCIGQIYRKYSGNASQVFNQRFYNAIFNGNLATEFPEIKRVFDENTTGLKQTSIPSLNLHGGADPIVTTPSQKQFMSRSCAVGNQITYIEYPGVHHYQTRQTSFRDSLRWMENILAGNTVSNYCQ